VINSEIHFKVFPIYFQYNKKLSKHFSKDHSKNYFNYNFIFYLKLKQKYALDREFGSDEKKAVDFIINI
jgi:hypothetical protein